MAGRKVVHLDVINHPLQFGPQNLGYHVVCFFLKRFRYVPYRGTSRKIEVQTTILYSIESFSFALSINVTKNPAPTFLSTLPRDIEKIYNKIVCKSEG